ncbi:DNA cytosine methyltransferase [Advenella mimigardefordensis]|uniref:Cytosine-specific methyltransferase n=1 Tax=Advenella mimigardefordensis (strain DSM 17166 / LMG 22922 / DPN7) TaxID=1247726 RepID=W0PI56_ADVMD|nr:DNA cytosine methyltransferase [Advenella mimigardefordensis]AHG65487.1 putative DNA (cytosine-5-)-methyltransferase [Advenella mimigardefordensis DPN7]
MSDKADKARLKLIKNERTTATQNDRFTTIDLFCGAGGIAEGFKQAGYRCLYGNDIMQEAIETFAANHPHAIADCRSIELVEPVEIRQQLGLEKGELDVLVGGPPCQGFSINAPERFLSDPRNKLFRHYERFLEEFEPKAFVFENVPGLLSLADGKVFNQIIKQFTQLGYNVTAKILFAAHYGVPQERWRLILLGSKNGEIAHPVPTHYAKGRANFRGGKTMTFQLSDNDSTLLLAPITIKDAIGDLPRLEMGEGAEEVGYTTEARSDYAVQMRNTTGVTFNHYAAKLSKINAERMKHVKPGGSWRDIPHDLLPKGMQRARKSDHTKRYGRLHPDSLAGTVLTKCDPHWGTVFLPDQDRTLTVREAARLQSFPDSYRFLGSRVTQYAQVGNAVPVLMARALGETIQHHLKGHPQINESRVAAANG